VKVFISWSGDLSRQAASILKDWLPSVIQQLEPYMSEEDVEKGTRWAGALAGALEECNFGIICLTPANLNAPWINFEAGSLAKVVSVSHVTPLLLGLKPSDVKWPLAQFQTTSYNERDVRRLINDLNASLGSGSLNPTLLNKGFEMWWPNLQAQLDPLDAEAQELEPEKLSVRTTSEETLEEILELVREQQRLLNSSQMLASRFTNLHQERLIAALDLISRVQEQLSTLSDDATWVTAATVEVTRIQELLRAVIVETSDMRRMRVDGVSMPYIPAPSVKGIFRDLRLEPRLGLPNDAEE